jgi:hypothetical protein
MEMMRKIVEATTQRASKDEKRIHALEMVKSVRLKGGDA